MTLSIVAKRTVGVIEVEVTSITPVSMKSHILLENYLLIPYFGIY